MRRLLVLLVALLVAPRVARADEAPARGAVIALLPLGADAKLEIYGQPVASELARRLEREGFAVVVVTSTAPVPARARLVVDGRIVRGDGDTVKIEARVRDPERGLVVDELSAKAPSLTRIDEAVADLARRLATVLRTGLAAQAAARARERAGAAPVTTAAEAPQAAPVVDRRPAALITATTAVMRGAEDPDLAPILRAGAVRLADLVGYRAEDLRGDADDLAGAVARADASVGIELRLLAIDYDDEGVTTARARARVRVVSGGRVVWNRVVRTDTLVGGRGDRRDAVARAAIEQIVDIAMPRVREQLGKAAAK